MSKYKHVTWRGRALSRSLPWQAQVDGEYLGSFANEELAAQAVAKKLRQPKASLLRPAPKRKHKYVDAAPKRTHKYVYWHMARQKWQVKIGTAHHGMFANHEDALRRAIAITKQDGDSLQLHPDVVRRSLQGQHNAVAQQASWFQDLYAAYSKPDEVAYPGDLCDMHARALRKSCILAHPNFIVPMLLAKFGPHRDALHHAFLHTPKQEQNALDLKWTYDVIVAALVALSSMDTKVMDPWFAGPGKTSAHHSGLVVYAHVSLKIMVACDAEPNPRKRRRALVFGKHEPRGFLIQPYSKDLENKLIEDPEFRAGYLEDQASSIIGAVVRRNVRHDSCH